LYYRVPRHLRLLVEQQSRKVTNELDGNLPKFPIGKLEILGQNDDFPFLGSLEKGSFQPTVASNMYCAPIFPQKAIAHDFILIRTKVASKLVTFSIREIDKLYIVGQLEPSQKVHRPVKNKNLTKEQEDFITLQIVRKFQETSEGVGVDFEVIRNMFRVSQFKPGFHESNLKRIMRQFAFDMNDRWFEKNFTNDRKLNRQEAAEKAQRFSLEELEGKLLLIYIYVISMF
jgi:Protein of unknown function (DUF3591)